MNLEQRVMALEQEVELLKAQIQTTLLDIQEQLLNQTYPILRGEEPTRAPAPEIITPPTPSPVQKIRLADATPFDDDDDDVPAVTMFRKSVPTPVEEVPEPVVPQPPKAVVPQPTKAVIPQPPPAARALDWPEQLAGLREPNPYDWIELENWVSQKVEKLGIERTRELINLYAKQERFTEQERQLLMQFVDIYESANHPTLPNMPASSPKSANANGSIVPQTRAVVAEIREELRKKNAAANGQRETTTETVSEQQGLVLRLIAGILNAGDDTPPASSNGHKKR